MKEKIGFVGLGQMGKWMALNVIKAGYPLMFFDLRKDMFDEMIQGGGKAASSLKELGRESDWVVLSLPDDRIVGEVLFGKEGMAEVLRPGQVVIDCGTIHPLASREFTERLKQKGVVFLDAPVSGMEARAKAGTLTVMVGGDEGVFRQIRPVLEAFGNNILYVGPSGNGQLMKLINQLLFNINCAGLAEVLPMAVRMGLDAEQVCQVARSGTGQSFALDMFSPLILEGNFGPGYPLSSAYKDMVHATEISSREKIPLPVMSAAMATYQLALNQGLGKENKGAMIKVWEKVVGVQVRKKGKN